MWFFGHQKRVQGSCKIPANLQKKLLQAGIFIQDLNARPLVCMVRKSIEAKTSFYCHYLSQIFGPVTYQWVNQSQFERLLSTTSKNTFPDREKYVTQWFLQLVEKTYCMGCSDVHFEPYRHTMQILTRNNGVLSPYATCPSEWQSTLVFFLLWHGDVSVQHSRWPLYGKWSYAISNEIVSVRISMMPCLHGTSIVLRFHFDCRLQGDPLNALSQTQFADAVQHIIPGLWLIAAPAGCGKTTVYYHLLQQLQSRYRVFSFENPIEKPQPQLLQWSVSPHTQNVSEQWMKILLRHSVQVIGWGEVRSKEDLQFVVNAAITGHCVLTTFHASNLEDVVRRLEIFGYSKRQQGLFLKGVLFPKWVHTDSGRQLAFEEKIFKRA